MTFDQIIVFLTTKHALVIYAIIAGSAFIENIFPPYPSDTIILAGAYMAGQGNLSYVHLFIFATIGGLAGAMVLYALGYVKGRSYFIKYNKAYFKLENMTKIERWFSRWGDLVLIVSRFIAGVRSIIAIAAGIGQVPPARMTIFSAISFALWYLFLIGGMFLLKSNWHKLVHIIKTYTIFLIIISAVIMTIWLVIIYMRSRKKA
jgi:membrane protein DedA with SNARE-associated domain